jgi:hypothetical protein
MRGVLALVVREVAERRRVLLAAALAATIPFLAPVARGLHGTVAREARETTAVILALGFAGVLSAALGWSVLSRELADGRISFYFSRPLSGAAIWAGKLSAAFLLAIGAAAIVWLPALAASRFRVELPGLPGWALWAVPAGSLFVILLAHAAGVALRARSALLAADAACFVVLYFGGLWVVSRLVRRQAMTPVVRGLEATVVGLLAGLVVGGLAAVLRGRIDIRRAHRALSLWIWGSFGAALAGFGLYAAWVLSPKPADLHLAGAVPAPRGTWVAVSGDARSAPAGFLVDAATGRSLFAGSAWPKGFGWFPAAISGDGIHAAWFEPTGDPGPYDLVAMHLDDPDARPRRTTVSIPTLPLPFHLALSPDGSRFATIADGTLSIGDLATGRSLGSLRVREDDQPLLGMFLGNDRFRTFGWSWGQLDLGEFDVARRSFTRLGSIPGLEGWYSFCVDRSGRRLLVRERAGVRLRLFSAENGEPIALLAAQTAQRSSWARFLSDGRIVFATADGTTARVRLFDAQGTPVREIPLPSSVGLMLGGEPEPGKVFVALPKGEAFWEGSLLYLVDLDRGKVEKKADDLTPVTFFEYGVSRPAVGPEAAKLFYGPGRSLVRFDPATGERKTLLPGGRH